MYHVLARYRMIVVGTHLDRSKFPQQEGRQEGTQNPVAASRQYRLFDRAPDWHKILGKFQTRSRGQNFSMTE